MLGIPKTDAERVMSHYGLSREEAEYLLSRYPVNDLLPPKGSGLGGMSMDELVGYTTDDMRTAFQAFDQVLDEGESAKLTLCTEQVPTEESIATFYNQAIATGFTITYPAVEMVNGIPVTSFVFTKGFAFALLLPLVIPLATLGLISFGIIKLPSISESLRSFVVPILLIVGGVLLVTVALVRKPATAYIERGGKIPYLPANKKRGTNAWKCKKCGYAAWGISRCPSCGSVDLRELSYDETEKEPVYRHDSYPPTNRLYEKIKYERPERLALNYMPSVVSAHDNKKPFTDRNLARWEQELGITSWEYDGRYILGINKVPGRSGEVTWYRNEGDAIKMAQKIYMETGINVVVQDKNTKATIFNSDTLPKALARA